MITSRAVSWIVWALASVFYAYQYVIRVMPNILMPEIMGKFDIDATLFGQFSGIYYIGYTLVHLPIGVAMDRIGPKYVIPACMVLTAVGLLPIVYADNWVYPIIGRFIIGIGSSAAILGAFKVIRMCFKERHFTVMLGITVTIGLLGAIYGGQPVNLLLNSFGWEYVLQMVCYIGLALAVFSYFIIPKIKKEKKETSIRQDLKQVMTNPLVIIVCVLGGLMVGPLEGFADAWSTEFFRTVYSLDEATASTLPSMIFLGMCVGAPLLSYLAAKTKGDFEVIILSALIMMVSFITMMFYPLPVAILSLLLFGIGIMCGYQILVIYKASSYVPAKLVSITTAFANMIIMTFGYFFHTAIGGVMSASWQDAMEGARKVYSSQTFMNGISIIPLTLGIAAIGFTWILLRQKSKKRKYKKVSNDEIALNYKHPEKR